MPNPEPVPQKKRGCFFYGCITCVILLIVVIIGVFVAVKYAVNFGRRMVAEYTDTSPMTLPKEEMPADQLKQLQERVKAFGAAMDSHSNTPPLALTGPEVNELINTSPDLAQFRNHFYVTLEGDEIKGEVSMPLDGITQLRKLNVSGRYLNGTGTFKAGVTNGNLFLSIQSLEVKGKPLPGNIVTALQQQNLAEKFNNGQNNASLQRIESAQVKDGTLIVTPKSN